MIGVSRPRRRLNILPLHQTNTDSIKPMKIKESRSLCARCMSLSLCFFFGTMQAQTSSPTLPVKTPDALKTISFDTNSSAPASSSSNELPDAPQATLTTSTPESIEGQQTKRILGIFPNFRSVGANVQLPPQTVDEKFITATHDSFDYSSIFIPAVVAGYSQATNATPEFHQGAAGYGRYFWHTYLDQTSENYFVEFIVPVITHEDTRYYTLGSGGFWKRTGYSLSRSVITRSDAGHETFNISEIVGAGAAASVSNLYYPSGERTFNNTASRWGLNVGIDAITFCAHEFWPDINHALFHGNKTTN
jgi:hypothetical protein